MKSRQTQSWLRPGGLLARLFLAPSDERAVSLQGFFRFDLAEIWGLGQKRRSQCLAALLRSKCNQTAVDAPDGSVVEHKPTDGGLSHGRARKIDEPSVNRFTENPRRRCHSSFFVEDHMSTTVTVSADAAESVNAPRQRSYLWIAVLVLGAIIACAIAAWFYADTPLVDTLMIAT
jgi:hypothetical protein